MLYLEAPNRIIPADQLTFMALYTKSIFLAGGITGVWDWQAKATEVLSQFDDLFILNPRRKNFEVFKSDAGFFESKEQIEWEFDHLEIANQILFWFSRETIQPIALYELGTRLMEARETRNEGYKSKTIFVGVDPEYSRLFDLKIQIALLDNALTIADSLDALLLQVVNYNKLLLKEKREGG